MKICEKDISIRFNIEISQIRNLGNDKNCTAERLLLLDKGIESLEQNQIFKPQYLYNTML